MDVFPTLAAAAGVEAAAISLPFDGRNMWPAIASGKVQAREEDIIFGTGGDRCFQYGVYHSDWKLVRTISRKGKPPENLLFRVEEDPEEKNDLAAKNPEIVKDLAAKADAWRALYPKDGIVEPEEDRAPRGVRAEDVGGSGAVVCGADALVRAGPPGPAAAERRPTRGSAAVQGDRPTFIVPYAGAVDSENAVCSPDFRFRGAGGGRRRGPDPA